MGEEHQLFELRHRVQSCAHLAQKRLPLAGISASATGPGGSAAGEARLIVPLVQLYDSMRLLVTPGSLPALQPLDDQLSG